METKEIKIQINVPDGKKLVGTKVENGVIIPIFKDKEVELPNTWEEWVKLNSKIEDEYFIAGGCIIKGINSEMRTFNIDTNLLATQKDAEAILALVKLKRLRDTYRQGWVPNWETTDDKYSIEYYKDRLGTNPIYNKNEFLAFQTLEIRDKFLENFKDLIVTAKEFI